jgi:hypothetical protein
MTLAAVVHTTGINWESVTAIVGCIVLLMTTIGGIFAWYVSIRITSAIDRFRVDVVTTLAVRVAAVELKQEVAEKKDEKKRRF